MSKPARRQYTSHAASPHKSNVSIRVIHELMHNFLLGGWFGWVHLGESTQTPGEHQVPSFWNFMKFCLNDIDFIRFPKLERRQTGPCWGWCSQLSSSCCAVWEPLQVSDFRHSRLQRWQFARCSALNCPWPGHALLNPATHVWSATDTKPMNFKASWFGSHR